MSDQTNVTIGLRYKDLDDAFFQNVVDNLKPGATLVKYVETAINVEANEGLLSSVHGKEDNVAIIGLKAFRIHYTYSEPSGNGSDQEATKDVLLKVKKETSDAQHDYSLFFGTFDEDLKRLTKEVSGNLLWKDLTLRDLYIFDLNELQPMKDILPKIYHRVDNRERRIYAYVMDNFASPVNGYSQLNLGDTPEKWSQDDVTEILKKLANVHGYFLGNTDALPSTYSQYLDPPLNAEVFTKLKPLLACHHSFIMRTRPEYFPDDILDTYTKAFANTDAIFAVIDASPKTLTHSDCTIRNMCKRNIEGQGPLCVYDWESSELFVPHSDIIDFLQMWLPADVTIDTWYKYLDIYRQYLLESINSRGGESAAALEKELEWDNFKKVADMCFLQYFMARGHMYMTASICVQFELVHRCRKVWHTVLRHLKTQYDFLK